jgi:hypothetical protein
MRYEVLARHGRTPHRPAASRGRAVGRRGGGVLRTQRTTRPAKLRVACALLMMASAGIELGDDSRFFALLGSAPQELNTVRPEAKLTC